jgi:hypothetical protein
MLEFIGSELCLLKLLFDTVPLAWTLAIFAGWGRLVVGIKVLDYKVALQLFFELFTPSVVYRGEFSIVIPD